MKLKYRKKSTKTGKNFRGWGGNFSGWPEYIPLAGSDGESRLYRGDTYNSKDFM